MKEQMVRTVGAAAARWRRHASSGTTKLRALPVDGSRTLDGDVLAIHGKNQSDVPVVQCRVAAERNCICRVVLFAIRTAEQFSLRRDMQGDVALHLHPVHVLDELAGMLHRGPRWPDVRVVEEMETAVKTGGGFRSE